MVIIFNDVSCQFTEATKQKVEERKKDKISNYKQDLKTFALGFYTTAISDQTMLGEKAWKDLKTEVCRSEEYKNAEWYKSMPDYMKLITSTLKEKQLEVGE